MKSEAKFKLNTCPLFLNVSWNRIETIFFALLSPTQIASDSEPFISYGLKRINKDDPDIHLELGMSHSSFPPPLRQQHEDFCFLWTNLTEHFRAETLNIFHTQN